MAKGGKRPGAGRPNTGRTEELRVYVTPDSAAKLSAIAKAQKVAKGEIVETLITTGNTYHIRFRANTEYLESEDWKTLPKRNFHEKDGEYIPQKTFLDEGMESIWFEAMLNCIPQIGWGVYCDAEDFEWNVDTYPMVSSIVLHLKLNIVAIELDWAMSNWLDIARKLELWAASQHKNKPI